MRVQPSARPPLRALHRCRPEAAREAPLCRVLYLPLAPHLHDATFALQCCLLRIETVPRWPCTHVARDHAHPFCHAQATSLQPGPVIARLRTGADGNRRPLKSGVPRQGHNDNGGGATPTVASVACETAVVVCDLLSDDGGSVVCECRLRAPKVVVDALRTILRVWTHQRQ